MSETRVRIFSDLHFRDTNSSLHELAAFAPLLEGATRIVFNGDTLDTRFSVHREYLGGVRDYFHGAAPEVTFLSGNHDPDISEHGELSLGDGRLWATHGDVFFENVAPWSEHGPEFTRRLAGLAEGMPAPERARIETRLRLNREVCRDMPDRAELLHASPVARTRRMINTLFPPTRVLAMLDAWRNVPRLAETLVRAQRPRARVVVLGHTHFPGVWHLPGAPRVTVINTGSFTRPFGARFVELRGDRVRVVKIEKVGREFRPGRVVAEFGLG